MMYTPQTARATAELGLAPLVMVIDDAPVIRSVVESTLRRRGFRVVSFADGLAAIGALARGDVEVPNLLLLDIGMPKMGGYEVAQILRAKDEFAHTVLIMLSGHDGLLDRLRGKLVGARDFITKPFNTQHLAEVVCSYLLPEHLADEWSAPGPSL
jgi:DNA-binding response OmpR family regulator